jgi:hypothetical protein
VKNPIVYIFCQSQRMEYDLDLQTEIFHHMLERDVCFLLNNSFCLSCPLNLVVMFTERNSTELGKHKISAGYCYLFINSKLLLMVFADDNQSLHRGQLGNAANPRRLSCQDSRPLLPQD